MTTKRGFTRGVITCDPSWVGLAFTVYVPSVSYTKSVVYNLKNFTDKKNIEKPMVYIHAVNDVIRRLRVDIPWVRICDKLIMESQFMENMKVLAYVIATSLIARYPMLSMENLSALTCKRHYKIPLMSNHYENKKKMFQYVTGNKHNLIAGDTVKDHNTADSIIILNTWLGLKRRHLYKTPEEYCMASELPFKLKYTRWECPICTYHSGKMWIVKNPPKKSNTKSLVGHYFIKCNNTTCNASTFFGKKCPVLDDRGRVGNDIIGMWKTSDGSKPWIDPSTKIASDGESSDGMDEGGQIPGTYNVMSVTPLGKRKNDPNDDQSPPKKKSAKEIDALTELVYTIASKNTQLEEKVLDMSSKTEAYMDKLMNAIMEKKTESPKPEEKKTTEAFKEPDEGRPRGYPGRRAPRKIIKPIDIPDFKGDSEPNPCT